MPVSSSVLFHFTNNLENLKGILKSNFLPRYCYEDWGTIFPDMKTRLVNSAIPMVCFCDIPLSSIAEHVADYGKYALGLSKKWAFENKLNPVLYMAPDSQPASYFLDLIERMQTNLMKDKLDPEMGKKFYELASFVKPYKGPFGKRQNEVKVFYNEREWRYIPYVADDNSVAYRLSESDFGTELVRDNANTRLASKYQLYFTPDDIVYILLAKEREILPLLDYLREVKEKYALDAVRLLTTRIQVTDQILADA